MIIKTIKIEDVIQLLQNDIIRVHGDYNTMTIDNISDAERVNEKSLDWVNPSKQNKQQIVNTSLAKVMLVDPSVEVVEGKVLIVVNNPKKALAKVGNHFFVQHPIAGIHPTAIVDPDAHIGNNVTIGPYCVIGKAIIGDNCVLDSNVRIYDDVVMGHDCVIKAGAVLGGAGFGFEKDENGNRFRFPQIGQLVIGDFVEVGSNTCIDRGALSNTEIGDYTKINNLCHIAHNNKIGQNVMITGCVNISGSNVIEDNVWLAPNASVRGWVHIGKGATVGMGAVVVKDVPSREIWVGNPAKKMEKTK